VALQGSHLKAKSACKLIEREMIAEGRGKIVAAWKGNALARFDQAVSRCHGGVVQCEKSERGLKKGAVDACSRHFLSIM